VRGIFILLQPQDTVSHWDTKMKN